MHLFVDLFSTWIFLAVSWSVTEKGMLLC